MPTSPEPASLSLSESAARGAIALEAIGTALTRLAIVAEKFYDKLYPVRQVKEATLGTAKRYNQTQEEPEPNPEEWAGPRETKLRSRREKSKKRGTKENRDRGPGTR